MDRIEGLERERDLAQQKLREYEELGRWEYVVDAVAKQDIRKDEFDALLEQEVGDPELPVPNSPDRNSPE